MASRKGIKGEYCEYSVSFLECSRAVTDLRVGIIIFSLPGFQSQSTTFVITRDHRSLSLALSCCVLYIVIH